MSSSTQYTDFSDLYLGVLKSVRTSTSDTTNIADAKRAINTALQDMHIGFWESLPWAERSAYLVTQAPYSTGTVTITQGSTTLTGSSTLWNTANNFSVTNARAGGKITIAGGSEVYEVSSVDGDTTITLVNAFVRADVAAVSYNYYEDTYALDSNFLRPVSARFFDTNQKINFIGRNEFRTRYPRNSTTGNPRVATIVDRPASGDTTPVRKVMLWRAPAAAYTIPYDFITNKLVISSSGTAQTSFSADADEPIVPLAYRHALVHHGLNYWYLNKKDDARAQVAKADYVDIMNRVTGDTEIGQSRPRIEPRIGFYKSRARSPYRGSNSRYTLGSRFDEIR